MTAFTPTREQEAALRRMADRYGRTWKSKLNTAWFRGNERDVCHDDDDAALLRQVRNSAGSSWLARYMGAGLR